MVRQAARLHSLYVLALPGVVGVLLLYGAYDMIRIRNYNNALNVLGLAVAAFAPLALAMAAELRQRRFLRWLDENLEALVEGEAEYRGTRLSPGTEVVVFHLAFSIVVASFKFPSQILVVGHDRIWLWRAGYSLVSLLFGWWGIPWGPVYTVQALHSNLRTQQRGRLLDMLRAEGWSASSGHIGAGSAKG